MIHVPFIPCAPSPGAHPKHACGAVRLVGSLAVAIAMVGLGGCGIFDPTTTHRVVGIIEFEEDHWPLPEIPETATAGVPIEMTIWTGDSGCYGIGETDVVAVTGRVAVVTPFDYLTTGNHGCFTYLNYFEHKATVVFDEPGTAEIVLVYSTDGWYRPEAHRGDGRKVYTVEVSEAD